jgi:hypothetical protein
LNHLEGSPLTSSSIFVSCIIQRKKYPGNQRKLTRKDKIPSKKDIRGSFRGGLEIRDVTKKKKERSVERRNIKRFLVFPVFVIFLSHLSFIEGLLETFLIQKQLDFNRNSRT